MDKQNKIRNSLRYSFIDGIFASCMGGLITDYVTPYALFLKATTGSIGALSALPNLVSSLFQFKSPDVADRLKSRKKIINVFVFLHAMMLLPVILIPYLFKIQPVLCLIIFITLFNSLGAFVGPAWSSLMSDYVPYKMRGRYFGWRNKIFGMIVIVASFAAGFILHWFKVKNNILLGFTFVFSLAFICRLISWYFLTRMYEPPYKVKKEAYFTFFDFIKRVRESNFARFVLFVSSLNFCVNLASPFFSVFMIRDLRFDYITYTVVTITVAVTTFFTIGRWGRLADKTGNLKVLKFTSLFIASLPLWWIVNRNPLYLIFAQIISGFAWSGFNLCATNFIYDAVSPEKRTRCIAYFNVCSGLALCLGALLGGYLANALPPLFGYNLLTLFLVSSTLRFCAAVFFWGRLREVRPAEKITSKDLFYSIIGVKTILGAPQGSRRVLGEEE